MQTSIRDGTLEAPETSVSRNQPECCSDASQSFLMASEPPCGAKTQIVILRSQKPAGSMSNRWLMLMRREQVSSGELGCVSVHPSADTREEEDKPDPPCPLPVLQSASQPSIIRPSSIQPSSIHEVNIGAGTKAPQEAGLASNTCCRCCHLELSILEPCCSSSRPSVLHL